MILCVGTTPAVQRVMIFHRVVVDAVNRATTTLDGVAGKSVNVAKILHLFGEHPVAVGFLGGDRGEYLRGVLDARGIESEFVIVPARTRQCVTVIDQSAGTHTELVEESPSAEPSHFERLHQIIERRMPQCRAAVMSGTIAPGGSPEFYRRCAELAEAAGVFSVVDAQSAALTATLSVRPGLVKPNRSELAATVGRELPDEEAILQAARELVERGAQRVVITAGKAPILAFDGRQPWRIATPRLEPVNPIGSGDAFTAGLVWRLLRGDDLGEACRWASAAGAANALHPLAGEARRDDVERLAQEISVQRI